MLCTLLAGVALAAFYLMPGNDQVLAPEGPASVSAAPVQPAPIARSSLTASGYIVARNQADVSARVPGRVVKIHVAEGDTVTRGQVLATLDRGLAGANVQALEADRNHALAEIDLIQAQMSNAKSELERYEALSAEGFATLKDLNAAKSRVGVLEAQRQQALYQVEAKTARLRSAQIETALHDVRAPIDGTVARIDAREGSLTTGVADGVAGRGSLMTLVDLSDLEVEVDVAEAHRSRVAEGSDVLVSLSAEPGKEHEGHVIGIRPIADRSRATFRVRIGLPNTDGSLFPEMLASVKFLTKQP